MEKQRLWAVEKANLNMIDGEKKYKMFSTAMAQKIVITVMDV